MSKPLLVANWKMNGNHAFVHDFFSDARANTRWDTLAQWVVCPAFSYLASCQKEAEALSWGLGAQDVSSADEGAYTGEVSAAMIKDLGCQWVIIGHSERRAHKSETNQECYEKIQRALACKLKPIYCIGESLEERELGKTDLRLEEQLSLLKDLSPEDLSQCVIAYEPIWAIGTGRSASSDQIHHVHARIRSVISQWHQTLAENVKILYGGSVKPSNANELYAIQGVDGFLIGGASLDAKSFYEIGVACSQSY